MGVKQSYQEVYKIIEGDLRKLTNKKLNEINKSNSWNEMGFQKYFYNLKQENPKRYGGLMFNTNCQKPYSNDLESILTTLRGRVIGTRLYIIKKQ